MKIKYFTLALFFTTLIFILYIFYTIETKEKSSHKDILQDTISTYTDVVSESSDLELQNDAQAVKAKVQLYEGCYFDERIYSYTDMPVSESPLIYCEIIISNMKDNSFDFTIQEKTMATGDSKIILSAKTANFVEDGKVAAYKSDNFTLTFEFPQDQLSYPVVKYMKINGMDILEGNTYMNNSIPGYESG